jgi:carboxypeptidase T
VPMVNVDGAEFDIESGSFRSWRKNRQPIPGSTNIGIDLNRNWGYKWGCCGGSSGTPSNITYRGPEPWFAPEVRALRDFVNSRVKNGRQQIREAVSWHTYGQWVMWPYGYTKADLPPSMTRDDLDALRAIGREMASTNGYTPQQLSDLYILDGASSDWLYHQHRIMAYTIEMYPPDPSKLGGFYPPDSVIATETERNRQAVLYFLEQADCPYRSAGLTQNCGPLYDDFEIARGWTVNPFGTDSATRGKWERALGELTQDALGAKQLGSAASGEAEFVTSRKAGAGAAANDIDGGVTSIRSPQFKLRTGSWTLTFNYSFAHDAAATADDYLRVSVLYNGARTVVWSIAGDGANANASWTAASASLTPWTGKTVRLIVEAGDGGADNIVEAALDDVRVFKQ